MARTSEPGSRSLDGVEVRRIVRREATSADTVEDSVVVEEPLEIRVGETAIAVTMRTPGHDEELAAGFCLTEGIVRDADELAEVHPCAVAEYGNVVEVTLAAPSGEESRRRIERARREPFVSSSCGLCGKQSIDRLEQAISRPASGPRFSLDVLTQLPSQMHGAQAAFAETGGLHAAAIFRSDGLLRVLREDVGRHNAVDKAIGHELLLGRVPMADCLLLVSGRASFEIVQKAALAGIPLVCAVSAPSTLAIDLAVRLDLTLVGFLRAGRMNVYHDPGRIH